MINKWSESDAKAFENRYPQIDPAVSVQAYSTRLLGSNPSLTLHGGGNTSVKISLTSIVGEREEALFVKCSGKAMDSFTPDDFVALDLDFLQKLKGLRSLDDEEMDRLFRTHQLVAHDSRPSIETLLHAFLPFTFIDHSHPDAVLALTNRENADQAVKDALGKDIALIPYARVGFDLACAAATAIGNSDTLIGLVIAQHGLVTWGTTAQQAYDRTIAVVERAERYLSAKKTRSISAGDIPSAAQARDAYISLAPVIRGALSPKTGDDDNPVRRVVLSALADPYVLKLLSSQEGRRIVLTPPLTPDYLIRTRTLPFWIDAPQLDDAEKFRGQLSDAVDAYCKEYREYVGRHAGSGPGIDDADIYPRILCIPGLGVVCAGDDAAQCAIVRDSTAHALSVKQQIFETGGAYRSLNEEHLFDMEFRSFQRAKLGKAQLDPLRGAVAVVTGSAGAIGTGICEALLDAGCHVAITDLEGPALDECGKRFREKYGNRAQSVPMDVTSEKSVADGYARITELWGGLDIVVVNAGIAHVAALVDMDLERFRKLEMVNVDGTLLTIRESGRLFRKQKIGGDIVCISTKNVFAPGAKFGAYSATKAAAHQLARIAVLEFADMGVRVNMVAPDAVFSHGEKRSGLWAEVGPDRMKARGLDEKGLEEYYRGRNLLKARVTAEHVARAVLFFVTHQTPTTGATIPVDGGLPDATPR